MTGKIRSRNLLHMFVILTLLVSLLGGIGMSTETAEAATIIYVHDDAPPGGNGQSWATAYNNLQTALGVAAAGDQVWVAAGTYKPTTGTDRGATFRMKNGVGIYGGFAGDETSLSDRDWKSNTTILSGNIGDTGTNTDNSYRVVTSSTLELPSDTSAVLDGFTITGGYKPNAWIGGFGAGISHDRGAATFRNLVITGNTSLDTMTAGAGMYYSSNDAAWTTLTNVTFSNNQSSSDGAGLFADGRIALDNVDFDANTAAGSGGGMFVGSSYQAPTLNNVRFTGNHAGTWGGGLTVVGGSPVLTNVQFIGNECSSSLRGGGGMTSDGGTPTLTNVLFTGNISHNCQGGGLYFFSGSPTLNNVTIANNTAPSWSEVSCPSLSSLPILRNCIIWGAAANGGWAIPNYSATYSNLKIEWGSVAPGTGNIDADPKFVSSTDLRLQLTSPCINTGDNAAIGGVATDLDGNPRIFNSTVDMGAYEVQVVPGSIIYVDADATAGSNNGTSWTNAYTSLQSALGAATSGKQIWVAAGTYKPSATDKYGTFSLKNGVEVYGGFAGNESSRSLRNSDPSTNGTILSGDINVAGQANDNSFHVVTASGVNATAIFDGFTIADGYAVYNAPYYQYGGGLYIEASNAGSPTLRNLLFNNNFASQYGGGAYLGNGSAALTNVTFTNNRGTYGGGVCVYAGSPTFTNVGFTSNTVVGGGGLGGALYVNSNAPAATKVTMSSVNFQSNHSDANGGAIAVVPANSIYSANLTINGGTFSNNTASADGGAIYGGSSNMYGLSANLTNIKFSGNSATGGNGGTGSNGGGAIWWAGTTSSQLNVTNCLFQSNLATGATTGGGAINIYQGAATITNCTFSGNTNATNIAGAVRMGGMNGTCNIRNSVFWGDSSPEISSNVYMQPAVSYSDVQGGYAGTKNINLDPKFTSNLHLDAGSPCIDAGNNSVTTAGTDLDGKARFKDDTGTPDTGSGTPPIVDMGAYEFQGTTPATAPQITSATSTTFTAGTAGTFSVVATGTLPITITQTGTLPAGVTFVDNGNGAATLSGTPGDGSGGVYPLTITATNSGGTLNQSFTLTVNEAPKFTSASSATWTVGQPNTFTVTTSGYPVPTITKTLGAYNFHDNGDGTATISGTPPLAGGGGTSPIYLQAYNGVSPTATQTVYINAVMPDYAPQITSADNATFTVGVMGVFTVTFTGKPFPSVYQTGAPAGVTLDTHTAYDSLLNGVPAAGTGGVHHLTITAQNGISPDATQAFTLTVNEKPYVTAHPQSVTANVGDDLIFMTAGGGYPVPTIRWQTSTNGGTTWTDLSTGDTLNVADVTPGMNGTQFRAAFTNSLGTTNSNVATLTVANSAPQITGANNTTFTVGTPGSFTISATGNPIPTISTTSTLPSGVTFTPGAGGSATLSGTPAALSGGSYTLTFTAANGISPNATQTFTLKVNEAPYVITQPESVVVPVGASAWFTSTAGGYPAPTRQWQIDAGWGFFNVDGGTGPSLQWYGSTYENNGYQFRAVYTNGVGSPVTSNAAILTVDSLPVAQGQSVTATSGVAKTITLAANDADPGDTLTYSIVSGPSHGTLSAVNGNQVTYTPTSAYTGADSFTFKAYDGKAYSNVATVSITVAPATTAPKITSGASALFTVGQAGSFMVTTTGSPTATLSKTGTLPAGVTFSDNGNGTAAIGGTPAVAAGGVYPITITAANGTLPNDTQSFYLYVNEAPRITSVNTTTFSFGQPGSFSVTAAGYPTNPTISLTTPLAELPSWLHVSYNQNGSATINGTPTTSGQFNLSFKATNGVSPDATQAFTLTVNQTLTITAQPQSVTKTVGETATFTAAASGYPVPTVQWQATDGVMITDIPGATSTTLSLTNVSLGMNGYKYRAVFSNSQGSATSNWATLTVTVANHPPVAQNQSVAVTTGIAKIITLVATDADAGDSLTYSIVTPPVHGTLSAVTNDQVTYTPASGYLGPDPFTFRANDGTADSNVAQVSVTVNPVTYQIDISVSPQGTGTVSPVSGRYPVNAQFTATPASGYEFVNWTVNGVTGATANPITLNVPADTVLVANFRTAQPARYNVTVSVDPVGSGTVSPGSGQYTAGYTEFQATAISPYRFDYWTVNGVEASNNSFLDTNISGDTTIVAHFTNAPIPYMVVVSSSPLEGGAVSPSTGQYGGSQQFTATPSEGYEFVNWTVNTITGETANPLALDITGETELTANFQLIPTNNPPNFTLSRNSVTVNEDFTGTETITPSLNHSDTGQTVTWSISSGSMLLISVVPIANVTINPDTGVVSISAIPNAHGARTFTVTANDGQTTNNISTQTFTLTVNAVNDAPMFSLSTSSVTRDEDFTDTVTIDPTLNHPDTDQSVTYSLTPSSVTWANVSIDGTTGQVTINSVAGGYGTQEFTVTANDAQATNNTYTQNFTLTVNQVTTNTPPVATAVTATTNQDAAVDITLKATDADSDPLTYLIVSGPTNGTLSSVTGNQVTYTPDTGYSGSDSFTYKANDGKIDSNTATVSVTVNAPLVAPQITSPNTTTFVVGQPNTFTVTATGNPTPSISLQGPYGTYLSLVDNGDGTATLSGNPPYVGTSNISIKAANGVSPDAIQAFSVIRVAANTPPVAQDQSVTATAGVAKTIMLAATDADNDDLTYSIVTQPAHGTVSALSDAYFSYTAALDYTGADTFTYKANDTKADSNVATVSITVIAAAAPEFTSPATTTFTAGTMGQFYVDTTGNPIPFVSKTGSMPSGVSFNPNSGGGATIIGTPSAGSGGTYPLTITASNSVGQATQAFTITVNEAPSITSHPQNATVTEGGTATFIAAANGYPAPDVQWYSGRDGDWMGILGATSTTLEYPDVSMSMDGLQFQARFTNDAGDVYSEIATLTVTAATTAPQFTSADNTIFMVAEEGTFTVKASGNPIPSITISNYNTWLSLTDNEDGTATLSGTPPYLGMTTLDLTATNSAGSVTQHFTLHLYQLPFVTTQPTDQTAAVGDGARFSVWADGEPGPTYQWQLSTDSGAAFRDIADETGGNLFLTNITSDMNGYQYRAKITNSVGTVYSDAATLTVTTAPANNQPVFTLSQTSVTKSEDFTGSETITPSLDHPDTDQTVTWTISTDIITIAAAPIDPANVSIDPDTGVVTITPIANANGTQKYWVIAKDSSGAENDTYMASFTLTVNPVNDAPGFSLSTSTVTKDQDFTDTVTIDPTLNHPDPDQTVAFTLSPASVTWANVSIDGTTGQVTINSVASGYGTQEFTVTADDGQTETPTHSEKFTLTVNQLVVNNPPVANDQSVTTSKDKAVDVTLSATDQDGDPLSYSIASGPANGTLSAMTGDKVTYTPNAGYVGNDSFTFKANDGKADSNEATVSITVKQLKPADLSIRLAAEPSPVLPGDNLTYTISVENSRLGSAEAARVTFEVPAGTTLVSIPSVVGWTTDAPDVGETGTITFTKATMATREKASLKVVVNVNQDATSPVKAEAKVAAASPDPSLSNNTAKVSTNVITTQADLAITQSTPTYDRVSKKITWTITVTNNGPDTAENIEIKDNLAKGTTFDRITVPVGATYTSSNNNITVKMSSLGASETVTITIVARVSKPTGTISNTAAIKTTTYDRVSTNNTCVASYKF